VIIADLFNLRVQVVDPANPERPILEPLLPQGVAVPPAAAATPATTPATPEWSGPLAGVATPVLVAAAAPAARIPVAPVRELTTGFVKKKILVAPGPLVLGASAPLPLPAAPVVPPPFVAAPLAAAPAGRGKAGGPASGLRAVLGVYGPVAVLVGVGVWLLRR
jgi:hypothetical protein